MQYTDGLNEAQKKAVLHKDGPLMILAGAGAGKTKTITHRIAHLISTGVRPDQIIAVTFTNKAAGEMRERVRHLLSHDPMLSFPVNDYAMRGPWMGTFHSLGVSILRTHYHKLGLLKSFAIYDRSESQKAVTQALKDVGEDPKRFEPRRLLGRISRSKGDGVTAEEFKKEAEGSWEELVAKVWVRYDQVLAQEKALDFDDLLLKAYRLLRDDEEVRSGYQQRWHYLMIDEYQDTNKIQYEMARHLAGNRQNIAVVGDIDQSIYSWRGANIEYLLKFEETYPNTVVVVLEENYRSTKNILDAANEIIAVNTRRKDKILRTSNGEGEKLGLYGAAGEQDEASFVAHTAQRLILQGTPPSEIAVLYRANFQSRILEEQMLSLNIPYRVLGTRFFDRKEVKDVLAWLRAALTRNPGDMTRAVSAPSRGIGKATLTRMLEGKLNELSGNARAKADEFERLLKLIEEMSETEQLPYVLLTIVEKCGMKTEYESEGEEGIERLENIQELVTLAQKYAGLSPRDAAEKLLEDAALATDQDELDARGTEAQESKVSLMTVHASKGLEFDYVFITGLEDGLFPHKRNDPDADDEEERRLFYVAITRARKRVFLTWASARTIYGQREMTVPSEFISDINEERIEEVGTNRRPKKPSGSGGLLPDLSELGEYNEDTID